MNAQLEKRRRRQPSPFQPSPSDDIDGDYGPFVPLLGAPPERSAAAASGGGGYGSLPVVDSDKAFRVAFKKVNAMHDPFTDVGSVNTWASPSEVHDQEACCRRCAIS